MSSIPTDLDIVRWAEFQVAFKKCSREVQAGINSMLEIIADPKTSPDDLAMTVSTVKYALWPSQRP